MLFPSWHHGIPVLAHRAKKFDPEQAFHLIAKYGIRITSAGYRIGPAEIEDCLMKHPAVAMVAVVGSPDEVRTEIVKAFVVPKPEVTPGPKVAEDIQKFVKTRLAAHEYPREIEFVKELPMTATGKIMRRELKKLEVQRKSTS